MAFDLSTAKPVVSGFDLKSAAPMDAPAQPSFGQRLLGGLQHGAGQFEAGLTSDLAGEAVRAWARASGVPTYQAPAPQTWEDYVNRGLGTVAGIPLDMATAGESALGGLAGKAVAAARNSEILGPVVRGIETLGQKAPFIAELGKGAATGATGGGLYAGTKEYADTGQVTPGTVAAGTLAGGALGLGVPLLGKGVEFAKNLPDYVERKAAQLHAQQPVKVPYAETPVNLQVQEPGQLASEVNPGSQTQIHTLNLPRVAEATSNLVAQQAEKQAAALPTEAAGATQAGTQAIKDVADQAAQAHDAAHAALGRAALPSDTGSIIAQAARAHVANLEAQREAVATPAYAERDAAIAAAKPVDITDLQDKLKALKPTADFTGEEFQRLQSLFGKTEGTAPMDVPEMTQVYESAKANAKRLFKAGDKRGANVYQEFADALHSKIDAATGKTFSNADAVYAKASEPLNELYQYQDSFVPGAVQLRGYTPKGVPEVEQTPYKNTAALTDAVIHGNRRQAQDLISVMGPEGAAQTVGNAYAHELQGKSAKQINDFIQGHTDFLSAFPPDSPLTARLNDLRNTAIAKEGTAKLHQDAIKALTNDATKETVTGDEAANSVGKVLSSNDPGTISAFVKKLSATPHTNPMRMLREGASNYMRNQLKDLADSVAGRSQPATRTGSAVGSTFDRLNAVMEGLRTAGAVTPAHEASFKNVIDRIGSLKQGFSSLKEETQAPEGAELANTATHISTPLGYANALIKPGKFLAPAVERQVAKAMLDPAEMDKLAKVLVKARTARQFATIARKHAVLGALYALIPPVTDVAEPQNENQ